MTEKLTLRLNAADRTALAMAAKRIAGLQGAPFVLPMTCIRRALAAFNEQPASAAAETSVDAAA